MMNGDKIRQMSDEELDRINCIFCGNSDVLIDVFGEGSVTCLKCGMTHFQKQKQFMSIKMAAREVQEDG